MKETDIRNQEALDKYLKLAIQDAETLLDFSSFVTISCPACRNNNFNTEFEKSGFKYVTCKDCGTLFANPRPPLAMLKSFYCASASTNFWINKYFKPVAEARRKKLFRP